MAVRTERKHHTYVGVEDLLFVSLLSESMNGVDAKNLSMTKQSQRPQKRVALLFGIFNFALIFTPLALSIYIRACPSFQICDDEMLIFLIQSVLAESRGLTPAEESYIPQVIKDSIIIQIQHGIKAFLVTFIERSWSLISVPM